MTREHLIEIITIEYKQKNCVHVILDDQVWVRPYCEKWTEKDALRISPSNIANYWQCKIGNIRTRKSGIYNKILESKCNFTINE